MTRPTIVLGGRQPDWAKLKLLRWLPLLIPSLDVDYTYFRPLGSARQARPTALPGAGGIFLLGSCFFFCLGTCSLVFRYLFSCVGTCFLLF